MISSHWEQVKSIFGAALELPEEERPAFIARVCGENMDMHAEVLTLLAANQSMGSFMKEPFTQEFPVPASLVNQNCFQSGEILCDRFKIVRLLGEGGMGRVYEALDLDLGVRLALKTIRPEISSDLRAINLFKHEIQLARQVTHPNVCRIFDLERHKSGATEVTFLTMELLEGETLESRLQREGAMNVGQALPLIQQMADGLTAIHEVAVVHRDFKPSNVLLVVSGVKIRVVITDFGLARAKALAVASESATGSRMMTGLAGTPAYMAPEQLIGGEISPATDIYALGLVIYKMVTGRLPYSASEYPIPESRRAESYTSPQVYSPDLDASWEQGIVRCLEIDPELRYQSAAELVDVLAGRTNGAISLANVSTSAIEPLPWSLTPFWGPRFPWLKPSLLAAIIVLAISLATANFLMHRQQASGDTVELTAMTSDTGLTWGPSLSADGNTLAYSSDRDGPGNLNIWVHHLGDNSKMAVTHDAADATTPALSPDGSLVAFRSERNGGGIYVSSTNGGNERLLVPYGRNPRFSPDGSKIAYWIGEEHNQDDSFKAGSKAFVVSSQGGLPTQIQRLFADARFPTWSSDGHHIMFQGARERKATFEEASDWWIEDEEKHTAIPTGAFSILSREGFVLYSCPFYWSGNNVIFAARKSFGTSLWELPLSNDSRATLPVRRLTSGTGDDIEPWVSTQGKLVLSSTNASVDIWRIPLQSSGKSMSVDPKRVTASAAVDTLLSVSSDAKKLTFHRRTGQVEQTLLRDRDSGQETVVPIPGDALPVLSDDGQRILYSVSRNGKHPIYAFPIALGASQIMCDDCGAVMAESADRTRILYGPENGSIGMLNVSTKQKSELITGDGRILEQARFSPDGKWMAYVSTVDEEHSQLRIASLEGDTPLHPDRSIQITDGLTRDLRPAWSPNGNSLFFLSNRDGFYCVWQLYLDPLTKHPRGNPILVKNFHYARLSAMHLSMDAMGLSLGGGDLFLNLAEITGNVFAADLR